MKKAIAAIVVGILFLSLLTPAMGLPQRSEERLQDLHEKVFQSGQRLSLAIELLHWKVEQSGMRLSESIERLHDKIENPEAY